MQIRTSSLHPLPTPPLLAATHHMHHQLEHHRLEHPQAIPTIKHSPLEDRPMLPPADTHPRQDLPADMRHHRLEPTQLSMSWTTQMQRDQQLALGVCP